MMRETSYVTDVSVALVTDGLGIRLKTPTIVTIPPHNMSMILLEPPFRDLHCKVFNTKLFEVTGNPLLSTEQPYLLILHTFHRFDTKYPKKYVAIAVNVGDEDIILNKDMTLCFAQETDLITKTPYIKEMDTVNKVDNTDMKDTKIERLENCLQEISLDNNRKNCHKNTDKLAPIPENSASMFHKDFYPTPRITLLDAELSPETQQ